MATNPQDPINSGPLNEGLSKREYFAAMAMQGLRAARLIKTPGDVNHSSIIWNSRDVAKSAVEDADALIKELNKTVL